jgi:hypothetical protein
MPLPPRRRRVVGTGRWIYSASGVGARSCSHALAKARERATAGIAPLASLQAIKVLPGGGGIHDGQKGGRRQGG